MDGYNLQIAMELNLYGISSMKIDKLKTRQVRKYIFLAALCKSTHSLISNSLWLDYRGDLEILP
jgi:hypothetical protein